jgi:hypothetical protein
MTESKMFIFFGQLKFCITKMIQDFNEHKNKFLQVVKFSLIEPPGDV